MGGRVAVHILTLVGLILPWNCKGYRINPSLKFWGVVLLKCVRNLIEYNLIQSNEKELPVERFELVTWKNTTRT
jgi:hypothetical protein